MGSEFTDFQNKSVVGVDWV